MHGLIFSYFGGEISALTVKITSQYLREGGLNTSTF